jgi:hypothetical protein
VTVSVSVSPVVSPTSNGINLFVTVFISGTTAGNSLVGGVLWNNVATTLSSVTATNEANGTLIGSTATTTGLNGGQADRMFYIPSIVNGGAKALTAFFSGSAPNAVIWVMEITGQARIMPDTNASWHQEVNGTTPTTTPAGSLTTDTAHCILVSHISGGQLADPTKPTSWTSIPITFSGNRSGAAYLLDSGAAGTDNFTWTIGASDQFSLCSAAFQVGVPIIGQQPGSVVINANDSAWLQVVATASKGSLSYQWQDNRSGSFANVIDGTGGTAQTHITPGLATGANGRQYKCIVTDTNGSVTSSAATITVLATYNTTIADFDPELTARSWYG